MSGATAKIRQGGGSLMWLQGLACGALAALAPATALLAGILLLPGVSAVILDRMHGRSASRTVFLFGAAAGVQPMRALWRDGQGLDVALGLLGDVEVLGFTWAAAAAGWLVVELLPIVLGLLLKAQHAGRSARLRAERERILQEWEIGEVSSEA